MQQVANEISPHAFNVTLASVSMQEEKKKKGILAKYSSKAAIIGTNF